MESGNRQFRRGAPSREPHAGGARHAHLGRLPCARGGHCSRGAHCCAIGPAARELYVYARRFDGILKSRAPRPPFRGDYEYRWRADKCVIYGRLCRLFCAAGAGRNCRLRFAGLSDIQVGRVVVPARPPSIRRGGLCLRVLGEDSVGGGRGVLERVCVGA